MFQMISFPSLTKNLNVCILIPEVYRASWAVSTWSLKARRIRIRYNNRLWNLVLWQHSRRSSFVWFHIQDDLIHILDEFKTRELLACDIRLNSKSYRFLVCYSLDLNESTLFFNAIYLLSSQNFMLIVGDFNFPTVIFPNNTVFTEEPVQHEFVRTFRPKSFSTRQAANFR